MRNPGDMEMLHAAVNAKSEPVYMATYKDVAEYYRDKYSNREWIGEMARAVSGSDSKSGKEYLAARRSIERHESGQYKGSSKMNVDRIVAAGMKLDPVGRIPKDGSISITVTGTQEDYPGRPDRSITVTFKGPDAYSFVNNPTFEAIWTQYDVDPGDFESGSGELTVTGVS